MFEFNLLEILVALLFHHFYGLTSCTFNLRFGYSLFSLDLLEIM